jgi:hypothetical protein
VGGCVSPRYRVTPPAYLSKSDTSSHPRGYRNLAKHLGELGLVYASQTIAWHWDPRVISLPAESTIDDRSQSQRPRSGGVDVRAMAYAARRDS